MTLSEVADCKLAALAAHIAEDLTMNRHSVRQLPAQNPPVETGPTRFGNDTTGVFIRADNALAFSIATRSLLRDKRLESTGPVVWKTQMENLLRLLESSGKENLQDREDEDSDTMGVAG